MASCVASPSVQTVLGHFEGHPSLGPAGVERGVRKNFGDLLFGDAVVFCAHEVLPERRIDKPLRHEGHDGDNAAVTQGELIAPGVLFDRHMDPSRSGQAWCTGGKCVYSVWNVFIIHLYFGAVQWGQTLTFGCKNSRRPCGSRLWHPGNDLNVRPFA